MKKTKPATKEHKTNHHQTPCQKPFKHRNKHKQTTLKPKRKKKDQNTIETVSKASNPNKTCKNNIQNNKQNYSQKDFKENQQTPLKPLPPPKKKKKKCQDDGVRPDAGTYLQLMRAAGNNGDPEGSVWGVFFLFFFFGGGQGEGRKKRPECLFFL